ncbi:hypothetical protein BH24BAC1_BH24BAC1_30840 [soil metagenome]
MWVLLALPVIFLLAVGDQLPARVPIHWNVRGEADGYGSPFMLVLLNVGLYLLLLLVPKIDPRKRNYALFQESYYKLRIILAVFVTLLTGTILLNGLGYAIDVARVVGLSVLLLLAFIGNYLTTIRPNWFVGIRTPWTLSNDTVWKRTHQLVGKLWFFGGLAGFLLGLFLHTEFLLFLVLGLALVLGLGSVIISFVIYKKHVPNHE